MKVIVVDNEQEVTEHLERQMKQVTEINEIIFFNDPIEALEHTQKQFVDVAFLDIEMPKELSLNNLHHFLVFLSPDIVNFSLNINGYSQKNCLVWRQKSCEN